MMQLWMWQKAVSFANVIMRVPPLFIIDELLMMGFGVPEETTINLNGSNQSFIMTSNNRDTFYNNIISANGSSVLDHLTPLNGHFLSPDLDYSCHLILLIFFRFVLCIAGLLASLCFFLLWMEHLVIVYRYLFSVGIVFLSYRFNVDAITAIVTYISLKDTGSSIIMDVLIIRYPLFTDGLILTIAKNYILQTIFASAFCFLHLAPKVRPLQKVLVLSFVLPVIVGLFPIPINLMTQLPLMAALVPFGVCKFVLWFYAGEALNALYRGYKFARVSISNYGITTLFESQRDRLNVPWVLRVFWLLRAAEQLVHMIGTNYGDESMNYITVVKTLMVNGCETLTAVLGMASIISYICHYIGCFFQWILITEDDEEKSFGTLSAMLFYVLALQSGLTSLDKENRLLRLCRNFCLLFTAILHFIHNLVNPLLMSLSASHNPNLHRHLRALGVCAFLIISPICLVSFLWSKFTISTWLLAASVFSVEVLIKVLISLIIYGLFLYDAYRKTFWEPLDDYVYIVRAFGNTIEFACGIIMFFNSFWILVFEAGGAIRAIVMGIHAYFNLWCEAKAGWKMFLRRRTAVNKINSLPEASEEQLQKLSDVCAICYQEMESAKITKCNHYFHSICLRKWLYVQDRCPLCHEVLYKLNTIREETEDLVDEIEEDSDNNEDSDR